MAHFIDQIGHRLKLTKPPHRIVSTVPSQTELLFDLGLADRVVGVTKFCIHPKAQCRAKTQIGGTKQLKLDVIAALQPDLILANKEENTEKDIRHLQANFQVWTSDITTIADAHAMIEAIGSLTDSQAGALQLLDQLKQYPAHTIQPGAKSALYLIWNDPVMVAGPETFIHHMMAAGGFVNRAPNIAGQRYPILTLDQIQEMDVDMLLLSTEPYPFKESDRLKFQTLFPEKKTLLVDGEMFSWYGSRMALAYPYFSKLQHVVLQ